MENDTSRGPEIYHPNTAPGLPYQDTQTWLPDGQSSTHATVSWDPPDPLFHLPHSPSPRLAPTPTPQPPSRHLPPHYPWVREPAHPQPRAGHPGWGGSLSNTNTKIHPSKSQKPLGAQVGPGPLGCNTGPCHQNPGTNRGLALGGGGVSIPEMPFSELWTHSGTEAWTG